MRGLFRNTAGGKAGAVDGLNLFFGALLGANLGTLDALRLVDYIQLTTLLAGTVMTVRMVSTSERRPLMLAVLAVYVALLVALVLLPDFKPANMEVDDLHRLVATLAVWVIFVLGIELSPIREAPDPPPGQDQAGTS
jgi:predicted membrane channel-forming protein YqfA (hemolysin III family)